MSAQPESFLTEARNAMTGVIRLFLNDRQGVAFFRTDGAGLMGSFAALFLSWILFLFAPSLLGIPLEEAVSISLLRAGLSQVALYGGVALYVKLFKQEQGFFPYIVAHNWSSLLLMPFQIGVLLAPEGVLFFALAGVTAFSLVFFLRTAQIFLNANFGQVLILIGILLVTLILLVTFTGLEFWGIQSP